MCDPVLGERKGRGGAVGPCALREKKNGDAKRQKILEKKKQQTEDAEKEGLPARSEKAASHVRAGARPNQAPRKSNVAMAKKEEGRFGMVKH